MKLKKSAKKTRLFLLKRNGILVAVGAKVVVEPVVVACVTVVVCIVATSNDTAEALAGQGGARVEASVVVVAAGTAAGVAVVVATAVEATTAIVEAASPIVKATAAIVVVVAVAAPAGVAVVAVVEPTTPVVVSVVEPTTSVVEPVVAVVEATSAVVEPVVVAAAVAALVAVDVGGGAGLVGPVLVEPGGALQVGAGAVVVHVAPLSPRLVSRFAVSVDIAVFILEHGVGALAAAVGHPGGGPHPQVRLRHVLLALQYIKNKLFLAFGVEKFFFLVKFLEHLPGFYSEKNKLLSKTRVYDSLEQF